MCILCSEEIVKKMNIQEIRQAGLELIFADGVDADHVAERIRELEESADLDLKND